MKKLLSILMLGLFSFIFAGNPIKDLAKAKETAKAEHKLILLKFSGSDWCVPCIRLQKQIMDTEQFMIFSEKNLVLMDADFPRLKKNKLPKDEQEKNEALAEKFNKDGIFPKLILMDSSGKVLTHWDGFNNWSPQTLIDNIKPYLEK